jgi:hypothetical protein
MLLSTIIFITFSFLLFIVFSYFYFKNISFPLISIFIIGIVIRVFIIILSQGVSNFDLESYHIIGQAFLGHGEIFPSPANVFYPYFPLFIYLEAFSIWISSFNIPYVIVIKLICLIFEVGIIYLLYLLNPKNTNTSLLYAVNPISVLISSFQGQFDALPIFFLLLAYYFLQKDKEIPAFSIASVAIALKTWPILFILPLISHAKQKRYAVFLITTPILSALLYHFLFHESFRDIIKTVYTYRGITGNYGIGYLLSHSPASSLLKQQGTLISNLLLLLLGLWIYLKKSALPLKDCLYLLLIFFVITLGFGIQWLAWIVPFLLLYKVRYTILFFLVSTIYIVSTYSIWIQKYLFSQELDALFLTTLMLMVWGSFCIMAYAQTKIFLQNK